MKETQVKNKILELGKIRVMTFEMKYQLRKEIPNPVKKLRFIGDICNITGSHIFSELAKKM